MATKKKLNPGVIEMQSRDGKVFDKYTYAYSATVREARSVLAAREARFPDLVHVWYCPLAC